jgi:hypothetical protein
MSRSTSRREQVLSPDQFALDSPFVRWYSSYHKRGAAKARGRDLFMGELAARRFSIGLDDDRVPVLGIAEDEVEDVMSMDWSTAAFLRRVNGRDWIALSCRDARIEGARAEDAVPLRLWLPTTHGLLDGWVGLVPSPASLRVIEVYIRNGKPVPKGTAPLAVLPLSLKGFDGPPPQQDAGEAQ